MGPFVAAMMTLYARFARMDISKTIHLFILRNIRNEKQRSLYCANLYETCLAIEQERLFARRGA